MSEEKVACFPVLFRKAGKAIQKRQTRLLKPYGLSSIHTMYLAALWYVPDGMTLKELCEELVVDKANTSRAISTLEELGFAMRVHGDSNVLKYRICLTKEGRDVAKIVADDMKKVHDLLMESVTDEEREVVHNVMLKVAKASDDI